jgi:hypothetical protein
VKIPACGHNTENYKIYQAKQWHFALNQLFDFFYQNQFRAHVNLTVDDESLRHSLLRSSPQIQPSDPDEILPHIRQGSSLSAHSEHVGDPLLEPEEIC